MHQWICLLSSVTEVPAEGEVSRAMSSFHTVSSSHWEVEVGAGDMDMDEDLDLPVGNAVNPSNFCQQFSAELKKKFQVWQIQNDTNLYSQQSKKICSNTCITDTLYYVVTHSLKQFKEGPNTTGHLYLRKQWKSFRLYILSQLVLNTSCLLSAIFLINLCHWNVKLWPCWTTVCVKCACIQNHHKMMELYNKQSLKAVQQHVSSFNMQVTKYRSVSNVNCCNVM